MEVWLSGLKANCFAFNGKCVVTSTRNPATARSLFRRITNSMQQSAVLIFGKVAEWLKALDSKSSNGATCSRVQIPPFPHTKNNRNFPVISCVRKGSKTTACFAWGFECGSEEFLERSEYSCDRIPPLPLKSNVI